MTQLAFVAGTLEVRGLERGTDLPSACEWDPRTACHRAPAIAYADVVRALVAAEIEYEDQAASYDKLDTGARIHREPRPYQKAALAAWKKAKGRGVVALPTGSGKSHVGLMAIDDKRRSTLVVAPTLDLVRQWYDLLRRTFMRPVGVIGGGEYDVQSLTVTTYDSAYIHMENLGARFGFLIFDECHHLPGEAYSLGARASLAPYRLGLSATPERADGRESELDELIGPIVYREEITQLSGDYLAEYETVRVAVDLSPREREEYESERAIYRGFLQKQRIFMGSASGWSEFIKRSARSDDGRRAMRAYRRQRELAFAAPAKVDYLEQLVEEHRGDRVLVFTDANVTAYEVSRRLLIPVITHQTKVKERSEILEKFSSGEYGAVATSRVLNEGVDVPDANVAVVMSGSGSVREHVQRLGRILRPKDGKRAVLYEIVTRDTSEAFTSQRRREHDAYR